MIPERRAEERYQIHRTARIKSKTAGVACVRMLDVAASGFGLAVPFKLPVDDLVEIHLENARIRTRVRYCECVTAREFYIGVEVEADEANAAAAQEHLRVLKKAQALERMMDRRTASAGS